MKIQAISLQQNGYLNHLDKKQNNAIKTNFNTNSINLNNLPFARYNMVAFTARDLKDTNLYKDYEKSEYTGLFEYIKDSDAPKSEIIPFMYAITKDEQASKEFIEDINLNPRISAKITRILVDKMGGQEEFKKWYYAKDGYQRAYEKYFKKEIFENNNVSVNDMIKISPNLMVETLKQKSLRTTGDTNFIIGEIPQDLGTIEDFREITHKVRESKLVKEFIKFRDLMENSEEFSKKFPEAKENAINPARFAKDFIKAKMSQYRNSTDSKERKLLEKEIPFLKYMNETEIEVNGKKYVYKPILRPYSTKILFSLQPENTENKYFVTMEMFNSEDDTCENIMNKENSLMRSDSPYLNALVDYYLRSNNCDNVPDIKFYDYKSNAVIYPFIEGVSVLDKKEADDYGVINEYTALNNQMKPLTELGIYITDCFYENFMKDEKTGKTIIVDNGHAKYSNVLRPGVKMIHMGFMDLYGRDFVSLDAGLNRALNN